WPRPPARRAPSTPLSGWRVWWGGGEESHEVAAPRGRGVRGGVAGKQRKRNESMKLPSDIGPIHFVGIGGIGMSGIAEVLINLGYTVQGSDASDSANVKRLRDRGVEVAVGHAAENLGEAEVVVVSTAIKRDNPELVAARAKRLPVV